MRNEFGRLFYFLYVNVTISRFGSHNFKQKHHNGKK